jgi:hypothetical protein
VLRPFYVFKVQKGHLTAGRHQIIQALPLSSLGTSRRLWGLQNRSVNQGSQVVSDHQVAILLSTEPWRNVPQPQEFKPFPMQGRLTEDF